MKNKLLYLSLGLALVVGLALISMDFIYAAGERISPSEEALSCPRFEERMDLAEKQIKADLKNKLITEEEAKRELGNLDLMKKEFKEGKLPRDLNLETSYGYNHHRGNHNGSITDHHRGFGHNKDHHNGGHRHNCINYSK